MLLTTSAASCGYGESSGDGHHVVLLAHLHGEGLAELEPGDRVVHPGEGLHLAESTFCRAAQDRGRLEDLGLRVEEAVALGHQALAVGHDLASRSARCRRWSWRCRRRGHDQVEHDPMRMAQTVSTTVHRRRQRMSISERCPAGASAGPEGVSGVSKTFRVALAIIGDPQSKELAVCRRPRASRYAEPGNKFAGV